MPKVKISEYSATANSNTDVASINIDEGCAPSGINNAIRAVMGHLKDFQQGTNGDPFNGPVNGTLGATTAATANVTTLTTSSTVTHNGGTANGVAYLNGSKVLTTGSALTFDGSNLSVGAGYITATNTSNTTVASAGFDASTSWGLKITNASTTAGTGAGIFFLGGTNSESWIGNLYESSGVGALSFQTRVSGTRAERMRIDSSGNLLVGTTAAVLSGKLTTNFTGNTINGATFNDTGNGNGAGFIIFAESGTAIGSISRVGTTSAVAYNTTSDYRLKTVTGAVTGQGSRIDALKPIDYLWKDGGQQARGFLAHEFQTVYPNSVTGTKDAVDADGNPKHQSMQASSSEVIADLVAEIQSLRTRITALESA